MQWNALPDSKNGPAIVRQPSALNWTTYLLLLLVSCVLLGFYCCELNRRLYEHQSPFYDSISYYEQLFRVMTIARNDGFVASLPESCSGTTTVCLPFLVAGAVADWVNPDRIVGIWIQVAFLFVFLFSLFYYLTRIWAIRPATALLGCAAFLCASCLFYDNGGVSDFRMDLGLSLTFGTSVIWYLSAMERPAVWRFCVFGLAAGACCLTRATAPVYLVVALVPLMLIAVWNSKQKKQRLIGLAVSALIAITLSGWFFVINFDYLFYYYAVWNTDANAKLPWGEALGHVRLAYRCIGIPLTVLGLLWAIGLWTTANKQNRLEEFWTQSWRQREWDYRIFWIGISPIALMVCRRAGLNPFVCMPAVVGIVLVVLIPMLKNFDRFGDRKLFRIAWVCLIVCLFSAGARGWRRHQQRSFNQMAAQNQLIDAIVRDSRQQQLKQVRFGVMQLTNLNTNSLYSMLLFDRHDFEPKLHHAEFDGQTYHRNFTFAKPAWADWQSITGETDGNKIQWLVETAEKRIDYLVVPDEATAHQLKESSTQNVINRYLPSLRNHITDGKWELVTEPIRIGENEFVEIYRRQRNQVARRPTAISPKLR